MIKRVFLVQAWAFCWLWLVVAGVERVWADLVEVAETGEGVLFTEGGRQVLFYQRELKSFGGKYTRNHYLHPVWDLGGNVITEDAPEDHLHQRGIYWAWHQVWVNDIRLGDAWECRDFEWVVEDIQAGSEGGVGHLEASVLWRSPDYRDEAGGMRFVARDRLKLKVYPRTEHRRLIDIEVEVCALVDGLRIGGSEDSKGYGGFSTRWVCPQDLAFMGAGGEVVPRNEAVRAGAWVDFIGSFGGQGKSGVAVFSHPENPQPADLWVLRRSKSMQNPLYPGRDPVGLKRGEPLVLRYRLAIHDGVAGDGEVGGWYRDYSGPVDVEVR
jgi:hypothetical protein